MRVWILCWWNKDTSYTVECMFVYDCILYVVSIFWKKEEEESTIYQWNKHADPERVHVLDLVHIMGNKLCYLFTCYIWHMSRTCQRWYTRYLSVINFLNCNLPRLFPFHEQSLSFWTVYTLPLCHHFVLFYL